MGAPLDLGDCGTEYFLGTSKKRKRCLQLIFTFSLSIMHGGDAHKTAWASNEMEKRELK